jgi:uncharacterized protein
LNTQSAASFQSPRAKLQHLFPQPRKKLWVVAYVNQEGQSPLESQAFSDVEASLEGGADAVVLINEWCSLEELERTLAAVRRRYPQAPLGVNYLGHEAEPYGYRDSFRLAREHGLKVVWTDFSGVDLIEEKPPVDLHAIEAERPAETFYCSGIHMKYSKLRNPAKTIEQSALQAMGWVDGVIVTGPKTGVPCDPAVARRARTVLGDYPLGVASGVTPENVQEIRELMDFFLVASSLQDAGKRIVRSKVEALRRALDRPGS